MTRDEHVAWMKARALEFANRGEFIGAVNSLASDLLKHQQVYYSREISKLMNEAEAMLSTGADLLQTRRWIVRVCDSVLAQTIIPVERTP